MLSLFSQVSNDFEEIFGNLLDAVNGKDRGKTSDILSNLSDSELEILWETKDDGQTILHRAVESGDKETVLMLLNCTGNTGKVCPMKWTKDKEGLSPVHLAIKHNNREIFDVFFDEQDVVPDSPASTLSFSLLNHLPPLAIPPDNAELFKTALSLDLEMARQIIDHSIGNPVTLYDHFSESLGFDVPATCLEHTVPLVVVGDSGVGKSTLIKTLQVEGTVPWLRYSFFSVRGADTHKAGIIPTHFDSIWFGKVVFFDLSSHREFVHEAILNCASLADAVYLIVVNLSDSNREITQQLIYWLSFVRYHHSKVADQTLPNVIIVGSHISSSFKLGPLVSRERFRVHAYPRAMNHIQQDDFNITMKVEMDCRRTSAVNAIFRYEIKAQCERIRQSRKPLPSKTYILYAVIMDLINNKSDHVKAVTVAELLQELHTPKQHCQLFHGTEEEVFSLCEHLDQLNLLLILRNEESVQNTWIVPNSYPFLCEIEEAIFTPKEEQPTDSELDTLSHHNGILTHSEIVTRFSTTHPNANTDLLIQMMIHYKYCEMVKTGENQTGYFFPHLLEPILDAPTWEHEEGRFMFAWTLAPESRYHYFMPHLIHHFLLQLSQAEELGLQNLERATRTLAWGDTSGVEVVVHIHSSQRLLVSMRSVPNHQLACLKLRNRLIKKIEEILVSLASGNEVDIVTSIIPPQRRITLPFMADAPNIKSKIRFYSTDTLKDVIINRQDAVQPLNHALPLVSIDDLLFFEPYYHLDHHLREHLYQSSDEVVTEEDYRDMGMSLGSEKLFLLLDILEIDHTSIRECSLEELIQESYIHIMGQQRLTYRDLRNKLDSVSFYELKQLIDSPCTNSTDPQNEEL